jgi:hypothetical protein
MARQIKKLLSKLELPTNDWVLSRFGGCEPGPPPPSADKPLVEEPTPESQRPASVAARLLERWFDRGAEGDSTQPPQSGERVSLKVSGEEPPSELPDRESCAS